MNILVAPNSMKGSLNAFDFADIIEKAFLKCSDKFQVRKIPVADGGDFTGAVLKRALNAREVKLNVQGPLGKETESVYFVSGKTAIIEMANASGMKLINPDELNPMEASTFGTGQLIADAIKKGCREIFIGIGGSATVDGGAGMMEALGFQLLDKDGAELAGNGKNLERIKLIKMPRILEEISIKIISDVDNPLLGEKGAAAVFGPQKGADDEMVKKLEKGMENWGHLLEEYSGKELADKKGAGAAGGMALPLLAYFDAEIVPGAEFVLAQLDFDEHVRWADIVITGEGKIDGQTLNTKAPMAVALAAHKHNKHVFAFGGSIFKEASEIFDGVFSILDKPRSLEDSMQNAEKLLFNFSFEFARIIYNIKLKR